eukprot:XP_020407646.1 uncharacterized protein LOC109945719 [Zea mays]
MFSRFQSIVNKMRANKAQLPYSDHERALKLLHALDRRVWEVKVSVIIELPNYETLVVDELFSKLKSIEIDHQTQAKIENPSAPTMALVSGGGSASNSSPAIFALSSLLSITEEQVESLGDEELALVASRFMCCPKKGKSKSGPRNHRSGWRKGKYSSGKYKSKGGFNKEALKKKYLQKAMIKECAFLASLSDLDHDSDDVISSSSDEETERRVEDKLNELCFIANTAGGFCTMALGEDAVGTSDDKDIIDDTTSEVLPFADDLATEIEDLNAALASQDKLHRQAARERREFRSKYESTLRELESARASVESELAERERDARITLLEKASSDGGLENTWLMDSGCSRHMTRNSKWFSSLDPVIGKEYITFEDKSRDLTSREFEMSMMGKLNFFLGLQIKQTQDETFVHQGKYTKDILKKFDMGEGKPLSTPMSTLTTHDTDEDGEPVDQKEYMSMIGSLLYLTATRPDIHFALCLCARF